MKSDKLLFVVPIVTYMLAGAALLAQVATGNIHGTVADSSGGVVPNCPVVVTNVKTSFQRKVFTNERGDFNAPLLPVGEYEIAVQMAGFQQKTLTGVILQVDQTATFQIALQTGVLTSTVEVEATPPLLEGETSSLGQVVEQKNIQDMPLNGRNPFALGVLAGGAVPMQGLTTNLPIVAGGGRFSANDILLDGVDDNLRNYAGSVGRAGLAYTPSVDAVQEFKVKTNNFSAEYGHTAGYVMNATIKAGTNEYHGTAWEFLRNDRLDANNFVSNYAGRPKAPYRQNQFGAALGGPVRLPFYNGRNHTFFFMDYEGTQIRTSAASSFLNLPPMSFRTGNFSSTSTVIYDPATRQLGSTGVVTDTPFPGNTIPASRLDPTALKYQSLIPQPNVGGPSLVSNNYLAPSPQATKHGQGDARIDHQISSSNNLMARVSVSRQDQPSQGSFIYSPQDQLFNTMNAVLSDTMVFSPTTVNEFRFGFNRANTSLNALRTADQIAFAAQNGLQTGPIIGFPQVSWIYSGTSLGQNEFTAFNAAVNNFTFENSFQWSDNVTLIRGSHTIKAGADLRRFRFDRLQGYPDSALYYFGAIYTSNSSLSNAGGLPYADFLLGLPSMISQNMNGGQYDQINWSMQRDLYFGPFIQDDWKVNRRLTLNIGFRYDLFTQPVQARDTGGVFDPQGVSSTGRLGIIALPGKGGYSRAIVQGHHRNLAPRFGFAYQASQRFVIRGGWGMFYAQREQNDLTTDFSLNVLNLYNVNMPAVSAQSTINPPYHFNTPLVVVTPTDPQLTQYTAQNPWNGDNRSLNAASIPFSKFPNLQQFSLSLQYQLLSHLLVEASYAGARGVHWVQRIDINQEPFQNALTGTNTQAYRPYAFINSQLGLDVGDVSSWYNAFNFKVEHRFSKGLTVLANYSISHSTDSGNAGVSTFSNQGNARAMNTYNLRLESGLSPMDMPQKFIMSTDYELPLGKGKPLASTHGWVNQIIGGWRTNGLLSLRSGFPSDVLVGSVPPVFAAINRPDVVAGQPRLMTNPSFNQYFNPAAFAVPATVRNNLGAPVQTYGNASRMVLRGPGSKNLDFSILKNFFLTEKKRIEFRTEAFNLSNTPSFQLPSARSAQLTVGNSAFGQLAGSQTVGRQVQFGLKLLW